MRIATIPCAIALALLLAACGSGGGAGAPASQSPMPVAFVSPPDCPSLANLVAQSAAAPLDATHMRVQHMGDPGSDELVGQIARPVTWRVGDFTGYYPADPAATQRGYADAPPPDPGNAFQLGCEGAGFLVDTRRFPHRVPLAGEGPSVSVGRELATPAAVLGHAGAVLSIEARVDLRHVRYQQPHTSEGTAQLGFFYYIRDTTTGTVIAHVIGLFDSRPRGSGGSGREGLLSDGQVAFASSPLAPTAADGAPVRFVRPAAASAWMRHEHAWGAPDFFRAEVPYGAFAALLAALRAGPLPAISPRPEDYRLTLFGVLGEVFPGTGSEHDVTIGASVFDLKATGG